MKYYTIALLLILLAVATVFLVQEERRVDELKDKVVQLEGDNRQPNYKPDTLDNSYLVTDPDFDRDGWKK